MLGWFKKRKEPSEAEMLERIRAKAQAFTDLHPPVEFVTDDGTSPGITVGEYVDKDALWRHLNGRDKSAHKREK